MEQPGQSGQAASMVEGGDSVRGGSLPIVSLATGELYGLADLYIRSLQDMLARHCRQPFQLYCYSDRPRHVPQTVILRDCASWTELDRPGMRPTTRKLGLFNPAYVEFEEFLYLDLTLVIRRDMESLLSFALKRPEDLVILSDWHYGGYNSSVMRVRRGSLQFVYEAFRSGLVLPQRVPGDQDFLRGVILARGLQERVALFPDHQVVSYKNLLHLGRRDAAQARRRLEEATVVKFHGRPKMHEAFDPRYYLPRRLRELLRGHWKPVLPISELRREWLGGAA